MEAKLEKDADSMVGKPIEYASSEYSASSEPPPAYKLRQANSVKIAKIVAFTVILSSFILGSFLLASTYLQAKSTCDQVSALDAILDKELMLETMQQDSPRSEALLSQDSIDNDLSKDEMNKPNKKDDANPDDVENINNEEDSDDIDAEQKRVHIKLPLDFDLSELAHNIMMNNEKSRMNCVVERRRTEEIEEPQAMDPFRAAMSEPKKEKVTGERIAIFCETGAPKEEPEVVQVRRIVMPFPMHRFGPQQFQPEAMMMGPVPHFHQQQSMGPRFPPQFPPQFMPQNQMNMGPPQMNMPPPPPMNFQQSPMNFQQPPQMNFQQQQMSFQQPQIRMPFPPQPMRFPEPQLPPVPAQMMSPPRPEVPQFRLINPEPQVQQQLPTIERVQAPAVEQSAQPEFRIQLRRIQLPSQIADMFPFLRNEVNKETEAPRSNVRVQQMPLAVALSKVGITPEDLTNIQRMAEEKFQEHIRELVADDDSSESDSTQSEEDTDNSGMQTAAPEQEEAVEKKDEQSPQELHEASSQQEQEQSGEQSQQILALGRSNFGRSLNPVQLPAHMTENAEIHEAQRTERAAFVHPR